MHVEKANFHPGGTALRGEAMTPSDLRSLCGTVGELLDFAAYVCCMRPITYVFPTNITKQ